MHGVIMILFLSALTFPATAFGPITDDVETIHFEYYWYTNNDVPFIDGETYFVFDTVVDNNIDPLCTESWATNMCRAGTFETGDGGDGVIEFSVKQPSGSSSRRQTLELQFNTPAPGAVYLGETRVVGTHAWSGDMDFASTPPFYGHWDEIDAPLEEMMLSRVSQPGWFSGGEIPAEGINPPGNNPVDDTPFEEPRRGCSTFGGTPLSAGFTLATLAILLRRRRDI